MRSAGSRTDRWGRGVLGPLGGSLGQLWGVLGVLIAPWAVMGCLGASMRGSWNLLFSVLGGELGLGIPTYEYFDF